MIHNKRMQAGDRKQDINFEWSISETLMTRLPYYFTMKRSGRRVWVEDYDARYIGWDTDV